MDTLWPSSEPAFSTRLQSPLENLLKMAPVPVCSVLFKEKFTGFSLDFRWARFINPFEVFADLTFRSQLNVNLKQSWVNC